MKAIIGHAVALATLLSLGLAAGVAYADPDISDEAMAKKLMGRHAVTLQWLGTGTLKDAGKAEVKKVDGEWHLAGRQETAEGFVEVDGIVTSVDIDGFDFRGKIVTQVTFLNGGKACPREGDFTFLKKGKRKYWRLQQMDNPCDTATDYVDIYLR